MISKALYAGTFDPFTVGHLDIAKRALKVFKELTILVAVSPTKKPYLDTETRVELLKKTFLEYGERVRVDSYTGLLVDYAKQNNIGALVRGLRPTGDFEIEFQMASMNRNLSPELETVFFMTGENLYFISSSLVKEVFNHGGNISKMVPKEVLEKMNELKGKK